jgi:hypothetical protein
MKVQNDMKNKMIRRLIGAALLLVASSASAANPAYSSWGNISIFTVLSDGSAVVWFTGSIASTSCTQKAAFYLSNESQVRIAHSSFLAGKQVRVWPTHTCYQSYDKVSFIDIQ